MKLATLAIIPARGGSKRIPRKNIREFCGKPVIVWSIETAKASRLFEHIVVSTDDEEIAETAREAGAEVPFCRPTELADDHTVTRSVINHAIAESETLFGRPDRVCCIYPTAPFMRAEDLSRALAQLEANGADFAFGVTSFPSPIQRAIRVTADGGVAMFWPEHLLTRTQDLEPAYHDAGQFYWGRTEAFEEGRNAFSSKSVPIILPRHRVHDLDTEEDWTRAELMFQAMRLSLDISRTETALP